MPQSTKVEFCVSFVYPVFTILSLCGIFYLIIVSGKASKNEKMIAELLFPPAIVCAFAVPFKNNKQVSDWTWGFIFVWSIFSAWILSFVVVGNELGANIITGLFTMYFWYFTNLWRMRRE